MNVGFDDILGHTQRPYLNRASARPFLKWAGGKRAVVPEIAKRLPEMIATYWEPFLGGGAVFFALASRIRTARLSDVNAELALTYQIVRNRAEELIAQLENHASNHSRPYYLRVRKAVENLSSVEVAARFIYLNKTCFNGLYRVNKSGQFNVPMGTYKSPSICDSDNLRAASQVLSKATIRLGDFERITPGSGDFVYADPPYDGTFTGYSANGFTPEDHQRLRDAAVRWRDAGAAVMVSNADTDFVRKLYRDFNIHEITAPRNISCKADGRDPVGELLITSYDN